MTSSSQENSKVGSKVSKVIGSMSKLMPGITGSKKDDESKKELKGFDLDQIIAYISANVYERWDNVIKKLACHENETVQWLATNFLRKLSIEAPVVLVYVFSCVFLHLLNMTLLAGISRWLGVRDAFHPLQPRQYVRLVSHIFGHENMAHLRNNMTHILMVGPSTEEVFGSQNLVVIILAVAISSRFGHILFGPTNTSQIGASGVVFALILLNSVSAKVGRIPVSFLLTAMMWTGDGVWNFIFSNDNISHSAHLIGAMVGTTAGYYIQSGKSTAELMNRVTEWNLVSKTESPIGGSKINKKITSRLVLSFCIVLCCP